MITIALQFGIAVALREGGYTMVATQLAAPERKDIMYQLMKFKNEKQSAEVAGFARELVGIPSVSLHEGAVAKVVEERMRALGYDRVRRDDAGNVVGLIYGRDSQQAMLLASHLDTVNPPKEGGKPSVTGASNGSDRIYGVGAADCKGGVAAQVYAGALLKRCLLPLRGTLVVAATVAEENGRSVGMRALLTQTLPEFDLKPLGAVLAEPTGLGLYYGHDGWLEIDLRIEGANPFHVNDAARAIHDEFDHEVAAERGVTEMLQVGGTRFEDQRGIRRATIPLSRRLHASDNVGHILTQMKHTAGLAAQSAGAVAVEVAVREEAQQLYNGRMVMVRHVTNAWSTDPFHPVMERARQALAGAGCQVRPGRWELGRLGMGTAGNLLVNEFKVPTLGYGPGLEAQAHAAGEYLELGKLTESVYGSAVIAHALVGIPVCGWSTDEI